MEALIQTPPAVTQRRFWEASAVDNRHRSPVLGDSYDFTAHILC
ncbi:MAG: hypothetical protein RH948_16040 [Cyclobacteriaceae bacterium]